MSERKVLTKYYPPDFDPSAITRKPKHLRQTGPKVITVRLMAPFSMKCTSCGKWPISLITYFQDFIARKLTTVPGEYIYKGRKFNARKETTEEKYLSISVYRFYIRCTRCSGEITFKTDPKNMDYTCERGAKRNFEPWRDPKAENYHETQEQALDRIEREENEEHEREERDKMAELEEKMLDSKREMAIADALDEIRTRNARIERNETVGSGGEAALSQDRNPVDEEKERIEKEIEEAAKKAFTTDSGEKVKRIVEEDDATPAPGSNAGPAVAPEKKADMPPPSFSRVKKPKKPLANSLGIKKKSSLV